MPATSRARPHALALGLILPLALAHTASAQQGSWVDPPPRASAAAPEAKGSREAPRPAAAAEALPKAAGTAAAAPRPAFAMQPRPSQAPEPPRGRTEYPRRLADMPAAGSPDRASTARALAADYLATVSGPGAAMVGAARRFYATRVRFYGRQATLADLVAEKRSFVRRWPERRYAPRAIRTACAAETCTVRTIVDFRAANPDRGTVSRGAAELILEVSFSGARPHIVGETGRVLRRDIQAGALVPAPGRA